MARLALGEGAGTRALSTGLRPGQAGGSDTRRGWGLDSRGRKAWQSKAWRAGVALTACSSGSHVKRAPLRAALGEGRQALAWGAEEATGRLRALAWGLGWWGLSEMGNQERQVWGQQCGASMGLGGEGPGRHTEGQWGSGPGAGARGLDRTGRHGSGYRGDRGHSLGRHEERGQELGSELTPGKPQPHRASPDSQPCIPSKPWGRG